VSPAWQRRGVGSALVRAGLDACRRASQRVVVVLGDPRYYGRFGFEPAAARGLRYGAQATDAFQVLELEPGALGGVRGQVEYLPPFDEF
jgi:putative acetyltransferase